MRNGKEPVFTCSHVLNEEHPVLYISKDDGDWQFLCGGTHDSSESPHLICLEDAIKLDRSLKEILDLPEFWEAERSSTDSEWERYPLYKELQEEELKKFLRKTVEKLKKLQKKIQKKFKIDSYEEFWYDSEKEILQFKNNDKVGVEFRIIEIGSYNKIKKTWMWNWGNESSLDSMKEKSEEIQNAFYKTGYWKLKEAYFESDEFEAWEFAALACCELDGAGVYRVPHDDLFLFFVLFEK